MVYLNRAHALAAVKKYNRVCLDGKPMHIELPTQPPPGGRVVEALSSGIRCAPQCSAPHTHMLAMSRRMLVTCRSSRNVSRACPESSANDGCTLCGSASQQEGLNQTFLQCPSRCTWQRTHQCVQACDPHGKRATV